MNVDEIQFDSLYAEQMPVVLAVLKQDCVCLSPNGQQQYT